MKRLKKEIIAFLLALVLLLTLAWGGARLLMPLRTEYGSMWDAYRQEPTDSIDLLIVGSSYAYCNTIPAYIWAQSGIASYVMAGPEQTPPISCYYIREACKTQSPRYIMLEVTGNFMPRVGNYTLANISYMPLSANRIGATFAAAPPSDWPGLLFPLASYHSRWEEITASEIAAHLHPTADPRAGYTLLTTAEPIEEITERAFSADSEEYRSGLRWLETIRDDCAAKGILLIPYIAPTCDRIPPAALETLRQDAAALGLTLTDFNEILPELKLDDAQDWFDKRHLNLRGAVKFSTWLGKHLDDFGITPVTEADEALWIARLENVAAEHEKLLRGE